MIVLLRPWIPKEDEMLLRWKILGVIEVKLKFRELAIRVQNGRYLCLEKICRDLELVVTQLTLIYSELFWFCIDKDLMCVWSQMEWICDQFNVLRF